MAATQRTRQARVDTRGKYPIVSLVRATVIALRLLHAVAVWLLQGYWVAAAKSAAANMITRVLSRGSAGCM